PQERGRAIGITGGSIALGIVVGPTLGGILISTLGWRSIFYVNVPFGLLSLYLTWRFVPDLKPRDKPEPFDWLGAIIVGAGLLAFSLALTLGQNVGFSNPFILALFALGAIALVAFIVVEQRVRAPMLDLALFRHV